MPVDCLALAAHPDDLEITSGGLIAKLVDSGRRVAMLDLAAGEMGTQGDADLRAREAACAAEALGVKQRLNLGLPDAHLTPDLETRAALAQKIRDLRPELVILPYWQQRHPDHRVCSVVGYDACYYAGLSKARLDGEPHRPRKIIYATYYHSGTQPTFAVDITEQFDRKLESIRCYKSQFVEDGDVNRVFIPGVDIFEYLRVRDRELGMRIRVGYAEGYIQKELPAVDDPLGLGGRSI
jgi:bacillithiol biosynthesis deacetylase BshB1